MRRGGSADDDTCSFPCHADAAFRWIKTEPTSIVTELNPCQLVLAGDHPSRCIRRMMGLVQIIGGVHINVGGVGIHLPTPFFPGGAVVASIGAQ